MLLQGATLWRVLTSHLISFLEFASNGGRFLVDLHLVPTLLQEICPIVVASVSIAEGNMFQIVIRLVETILHHIGECRMALRQDIYKHRFS